MIQDFSRGIKLKGVKEAVEALNNLRPALVRKTMRIAMNAAGGPILNHARTLTPKSSGILKQSLGVKVASKKNGEWFAAVGPKRGNKRAIRLTAKGKTILVSRKKQAELIQRGGARLKYRNPTRYAHLVEKGTRSHAVTTTKTSLSNGSQFFGKRVQVKARRYGMLQNAAAVKSNEASNNAIRKIQEGITKESARLYAIQTAKAGL